MKPQCLILLFVCFVDAKLPLDTSEATQKPGVKPRPIHHNPSTEGKNKNVGKVTLPPRGPRATPSNIYPKPVLPAMNNVNTAWRETSKLQCQQAAQKSKDIDEYFLHVLRATFKNMIKKSESKTGLKSYIKKQISLALDDIPDDDGEAVADSQKKTITASAKEIISNLFTNIPAISQDTVIGEIDKIFEGLPEPEPVDPDGDEETAVCKMTRYLMSSIKRHVSKMCPMDPDNILTPEHIDLPAIASKGVKSKLPILNKDNTAKSMPSMNKNKPPMADQDFFAPNTGSSRFNSNDNTAARALGFESSGGPRSYYVNCVMITVVFLSQAAYLYIL